MQQWLTPQPAADRRGPRVTCSSSGELLRWIWLQVLLLLVLWGAVAAPRSIVKSLPGYPGDLPFKLETGYVGVGETDDLQLFYYFVESERNPIMDPLVLWLTGGPGCSGFSGLVYEIGPISFDVSAFNGSYPTLVLNPYSWTKIASIIFIDAPVGTGFSYSKTSEGYSTSDTKSAQATYEFLRKWLIDHPKFMSTPLYVAGDSYSGKIVPMVALKIANGNEVGLKPHMNFQGYMLGNPVTDLHDDFNSRVSYAHRVSLISDELYESAKVSCDNEFVVLDPNNTDCVDDILLMKECTGRVNDAQILEPKCSYISPKSNDGLEWNQNWIEDVSTDMLTLLSPQAKKLWCRNYNYLLSYIWANDPSVQEALHVRNGTKPVWLRCNQTLSYAKDVESVVEYHYNLSQKVHRSLIYSGDHDMLIPYVGTQAWIAFLNFSIDDYWRPWFVDGQVVGYTEKYSSDGYHMTFATVKGAGHTAPEYMPKQCFAMIDRWFAHYIL